MEQGLKKFINKLVSSASFICGVLIAIWWIFYGMIEIRPTSLSLTDRIGLTICTAFLAVTYCKLISAGGFNSAKNSDEFKAIAREKTDAVKKGNQYKAEIMQYVKDVAKKNLKEARKETLESFALKYEKFFNDDGELVYLDYKKDTLLTKKQLKAIKYCVKQRIVIPEVFGEISGSKFGLKKRRKQREYEAKKDITNTITRVVISVFAVGMMFEFLGWSTSAFIYALFQIATWTASGISQRVGNYNFIMNEIAPQIIEDTLIINGYLELSDSAKEKYKTKEEE